MVVDVSVDCVDGWMHQKEVAEIGNVRMHEFPLLLSLFTLEIRHVPP